MHEFSVCQSIIDMVVEETQKVRPVAKRVLMIHVVVGRLRQIIPAHLQSAFEIISKKTIAEGSSLTIEQKPIIGQCEQCGWTGELKGNLFQCKSCGSAAAKIVGGRELYLDKIEIEQEE